MIKPEKQANALYALSAVLCGSRAMACNGADTEAIAEVLDFAEYFPPLLASPDDTTDEFRGVLELLSCKHPALSFSLDRFDAESVPDEWWE